MITTQGVPKLSRAENSLLHVYERDFSNLKLLNHTVNESQYKQCGFPHTFPLRKIY